MQKFTTYVALFLLLLYGTACTSKKDPLIEVRNNWFSYIYPEPGALQFSSFHSNEIVDIPIQNNTDYILDKVVVLVKYIRKAGEPGRAEQLTVYNIPPRSTKTVKATEGFDGTSIDCEFLKIISSGMKFIYPGSSTDAADPYHLN